MALTLPTQAAEELQLRPLGEELSRALHCCSQVSQAAMLELVTELEVPRDSPVKLPPRKMVEEPLAALAGSTSLPSAAALPPAERVAQGCQE
jgi:hypothetical protein